MRRLISRIYGRLRRELSRINAGVRRRVRWAIRARLIAGKFPVRRFDFAASTGSEAVVIVCLWNRPSRIVPILELLDRQVYPDGVQLYLWNNNRSDQGSYVSALADYRATGVLRQASIAKTPHNLGSIARFYWARTIAATRPHIPVIIIDDDEDFDENFVANAMAAYRPDSVTAWWAWNCVTSYHDRVRAEPGGPINHVGPGGSVMPIDIFSDARFFTDIPEQFRMLDDVWLSYFVRQQGIHLAALPVEMTFVMDETNQYHGQIWQKAEFWSLLNPQPQA